MILISESDFSSINGTNNTHFLRLAGEWESKIHKVSARDLTHSRCSISAGQGVGVEGRWEEKRASDRVPKEFQSPTSALPSLCPLPQKRPVSGSLGWGRWGSGEKLRNFLRSWSCLSAHQHRVPGYTSIGSLCPCGCCLGNLHSLKDQPPSPHPAHYNQGLPAAPTHSGHCIRCVSPGFAVGATKPGKGKRDKYPPVN